MVAVQASSHIDPTHRYTATLSSADKRLAITKMRATRTDVRHSALGVGRGPAYPRTKRSGGRLVDMSSLDPKGDRLTTRLSADAPLSQMGTNSQLPKTNLINRGSSNCSCDYPLRS